MVYKCQAVNENRVRIEGTILRESRKLSRRNYVIEQKSKSNQSEFGVYHKLKSRYECTGDRGVQGQLQERYGSKVYVTESRVRKRDNYSG